MEMNFTDRMKNFGYDHLPDHLQKISKPFHDIAQEVLDRVKMASSHSQTETIECLRKLVEAKDCAVRATLK